MSLLTLMIIVAPQFEIVRSASRYLVQIMLSFFVLGFVFLVINKKKLMLTCFGLCGVLCVFLKNQSNNELKAPSPSDSPKISIMHVNLGNAEDAFDLIGELNKSDADVVSFQELTPDWAEAIDRALASSYPYHAEVVRIDPYGKAIYSKYPIRMVDTLKYENIVDFGVGIQVNDVLFHLISSYIIPVLDKNSLIRARNQMANLTDYLTKNSKENIVFGEFNMVYWDEEIIRFRSVNSLNNSRKDVIPTALKVPYDHIFYSKDLSCLSFNELYSSNGVKFGLKGTYQLYTKLEGGNQTIQN